MIFGAVKLSINEELMFKTLKRGEAIIFGYRVIDSISVKKRRVDEPGRKYTKAKSPLPVKFNASPSARATRSQSALLRLLGRMLCLWLLLLFL